MKILPWILVGGGAFTMLAGWLASRASAQSPSSSVQWPAGYTPTAADLAVVQAFIDGSYATEGTTVGAAMPSAAQRLARIQQLVTDFGAYRVQNPSDQYSRSFAAHLQAL